MTINYNLPIQFEGPISLLPMKTLTRFFLNICQSEHLASKNWQFGIFVKKFSQKIAQILTMLSFGTFLD